MAPSKVVKLVVENNYDGCMVGNIAYLDTSGDLQHGDAFYVAGKSKTVVDPETLTGADMSVPFTVIMIWGVGSNNQAPVVNKSFTFDEKNDVLIRTNVLSPAAFAGVVVLGCVIVGLLVLGCIAMFRSYRGQQGALAATTPLKADGYGSLTSPPYSG